MLMHGLLRAARACAKMQVSHGRTLVDHQHMIRACRGWRGWVVGMLMHAPFAASVRVCGNPGFTRARARRSPGAKNVKITQNLPKSKILRWPPVIRQYLTRSRRARQILSRPDRARTPRTVLGGTLPRCLGPLGPRLRARAGRAARPGAALTNAPRRRQGSSLTLITTPKRH